jgi:hypothetical protein
MELASDRVGLRLKAMGGKFYAVSEGLSLRRRDNQGPFNLLDTAKL